MSGTLIALSTMVARGVAAALCVLVTLGASTLRAQEPPPNFVVLFADDQGYADVGCYGARGFETPNLDRMAAEGMRFTSFYASQAVCSASRASLMTGCYSNRVSVYGAYNAAAKNGLHPDEQTIAEVLKAKGYATGVFGKWHLGHHPEFLPPNQGFDEYFGLPYSNDMWPVDFDGNPVDADHWKATQPYPPWIEGDRKVGEVRTLDDQATLTARCTERALAFLEKHSQEPFFLYVPYSMPHVPLGTAPEFRGSSESAYGDVIQEIDASVGRILGALARLGVDERTLVLYTSDNGPWLNFGDHAGSALPLREGKGTMWEGGVRVPCIARWPGKIEAGTVQDGIAATIDVLPTIAEIADVPLPERTIDGVSLAGLLRGEEATSPRTSYLYYYGHQLPAVRDGRWKLHVPHEYRSYERTPIGSGGHPGPYARGRTGFELFDLEADIEERRNVADLHPEVVERLKAMAESAREELGDVDRPGSGQRDPGTVE